MPELEIDYEGREIDEVARKLDKHPMRERMRLGRRTLGRVLLLGVFFLGVILTSGVLLGIEVTDLQAVLGIFIPAVIGVAFFFETLDSASGMGFGTALTPLLFTFRYEPLQVVPPLLISEAFTGILAEALHHEFDNVQFSFTPPLTDATKAAFLFTSVGIVGTIGSITVAYLVVELSAWILETYVALLVIGMGIFGLIRQYLPTSQTYRPERLFGFALIAGINKGVATGGYGPIVTLGQIFAGVYEKTATAITSLAEGIVSVFGALTYFLLLTAGIDIDYSLFPSIFLGASFATIAAPYLVRVLSGQVLAYLIPTYAFIVGVISLVQLYLI